MDDAYLALGIVGKDDLFVVGCCHRILTTAAFGFGSARYVVASGKDGARKPLLGVCEDAGGFERRFDGIVIGSGDNISVDAGQDARRSNLDVKVIFRYVYISRVL